MAGIFLVFKNPVSASDDILNEILVKYRNSNEINLIKIDPFDLNKALFKFNSDKNVEFAEPNYKYHITLIPSDTYLDNQWYLKKIKAIEAWNIKREAPEITVAVIDTGVQIKHPDLNDNIWTNEKEFINGKDDDKNGYIDDINGWDFVNNSSDPSPKFKNGFTADGIIHGTAVAGILGASGNNAAGISGICWKIKIMPLKALDDKGEGSTENVIKAIDYAINNGADIINFSFVGKGYSRNLEEAIRRAYKKGIIIVAAAGNEQKDGTAISLDNTPLYPVCHDGLPGENMVIGVAALDALDQKANFTGYGQNCIDIAAPGVSMFSTTVYAPSTRIDGSTFNKYYDGYWSGTSMSVPVVSGATSLIESINPSLSRNQVIKILFETTDNLNKLNPNFVNKLGSGRLNLVNALVSAETPLLSKNKIIAGPLSATSSFVRIFNENKLLEKEFYAYNPEFKGGVNICTGDINGNSNDEIITGPGAGGGPHVKVFDYNGNLINQFFAYQSGFRGGVNVASGDVNGDGKDEIITGPGAGGGPHVKVFDQRGNLQGQFFAFEPSFKNGINISVGNVISRVRSFSNEILVSAEKGGGSQIKIFTKEGILIKSFEAYHNKFKGGTEISSKDWNNDGTDEIITAPGSTGAPHVKIFNINTDLLTSFYAFREDFTGGMTISIAKLKKI